MFNKIKNFLRKFKLWRIILYKLKSEYSIYKQFNFLNSNSVFIDLGANVGNISEIINDSYGCKIICYEPHPGAFKILNKRFDKYDNIILYNLAISNETSTTNLFLHKETNLSNLDETILSEASSLDNKKTNIDDKKKIKISTVDIKEVINSFNYIDCIKIDIEGFEYKILPTIFKNKKKIGKVFCEFHGNKLIKKSNSHLNKSYLDTMEYIKNNHLEDWIFIWI